MGAAPCGVETVRERCPGLGCRFDMQSGERPVGNSPLLGLAPYPPGGVGTGKTSQRTRRLFSAEAMLWVDSFCVLLWIDLGLPLSFLFANSINAFSAIPRGGYSSCPVHCAPRAPWADTCGWQHGGINE